MISKQLIGFIASIIAVVGFIPYFRNIFLGKTKPHVLSWFIWGILTGIGFAGQVAGNAGPGAWATALTSLSCFVISAVSLSRGGRADIVFVDWLSLLGAALALTLWYLTKGPLLSVILITLVDAVGFIPTFRKSYDKPHQETATTFILQDLKFIVAMFALRTYSMITVFYPLAIAIMNAFFVSMLYIRRRQIPLGGI